MLNEQQRQAVLYLDGPCLVLAGAGSGKTSVITEKMAYLLKECSYNAKNVFALTFTNKAAKEMSSRLKSLLEPKYTKGIFIGTFHSLGLRMLREESAYAGLKSSFTILDSNDTMGIVQELVATTDKPRLRQIQQTISLWKNAMISPEQANNMAKNNEELEAARAYTSYQATLQAYQAVDFDDLICLPAKILAENADVLEKWQKRVHYLLVDEYQDTNHCQYIMVKLLTGFRAMFTAVGDDDQAIYAWRGATVENLMRLTHDYDNIKIIKLEQNYRSVQRILNAANKVISNNAITDVANNLSKKLWSDLGIGEAIQVTPMESDLKEAESIAIRISAARFERQAQWRDFAVLYRSNHQARILEQAFRNLRIPYTLSGGQSFFDKPEIRDVVAWLRLLANDDDDAAFVRAVTSPKRGVGQTTLMVLGEYAAQKNLSLFAAVFEITATDLINKRSAKNLLDFAEYVQRIQSRSAGNSLITEDKSINMGLPGIGLPGEYVAVDGAKEDTPSEILDSLLNDIRYEAYLYELYDDGPAQKRWANVLELVNWLKRKSQEDGLTLLELVQHIALVTMLDRNEDENPDTVKLSTLHASKGLEYPHVYLIGVEEGMLPHLGNDTDADSDEIADVLDQRVQEERRLMYVGITRAKRSLHISWCKKRRKAREDVICEPSRFISEMGLDENRLGIQDNHAGLSPKDRLGKLKDLLKSS